MSVTTVNRVENCEDKGDSTTSTVGYTCRYVCVSSRDMWTRICTVCFTLTAMLLNIYNFF